MRVDTDGIETGSLYFLKDIRPERWYREPEGVEFA